MTETQQIPSDILQNKPDTPEGFDNPNAQSTDFSDGPEIHTEADQLDVSLPEETPPPEQKNIAEIRSQEVQAIAHTLLARKGKEMANTAETPQEKAINAYGVMVSSLREKKPEMLTTPKILGNYDGNHPERGTPLRINPNTLQATTASDTDSVMISHYVGKKISNDTIMLVCTGIGPDGSVANFDLPLETFLDAQVLSEADNLLANFPPDNTERKILEAHIAHLKDPQSETATLDDATLEQAARESGLVSADAVRDFIKKIRPRRQEADGTTTAAQNEFNAHTDNLLDLLDGKNIATAEDMARVMKVVGKDIMSNGEIGNKIKELTAHINAAKAQGAHAELIAKLTNQRDQLQKMEHIFTTHQGQIQEFFSRIEDGQVDASIGNEISDSLRAGNIDKVIESIMLSDGVTDDEKSKVAELAKKYGLYGGGIVLLILFALLRAAQEQ